MSYTTIWEGPRSEEDEGPNAEVLQDEQGGLRFCYDAYLHVEGTRCVFSLWCEVGEPYVPAFEDFHRQFRLAKEHVDYGGQRSYIADRPAQPGEPLSYWSEKFHANRD